MHYTSQQKVLSKDHSNNESYTEDHKESHRVLLKTYLLAFEELAITSSQVTPDLSGAETFCSTRDDRTLSECIFTLKKNEMGYILLQPL